LPLSLRALPLRALALLAMLEFCSTIVSGRGTLTADCSA
jgi:hypothetical protein